MEQRMETKKSIDYYEHLIKQILRLNAFNKNQKFREKIQRKIPLDHTFIQYRDQK